MRMPIAAAGGGMVLIRINNRGRGLTLPAFFPDCAYAGIRIDQS